MKRTVQIMTITLMLFLVSCGLEQKSIVQSEAPLRLTREEVLKAEDGTRIVVYFPHGVAKPVVVKSVETGEWVVSAKTVDD